MAEFKKAPTYRMFAWEIAHTLVQLQQGDKDSFQPAIFLSPTGAEVNKALIVGTATEKEELGQEGNFLRVRVVDPTGAVYIYAGQYQPEAAQAMNRLEVPCHVIAVGKISHYTPESGGDTIVSLRAESVMLIDARQRNITTADIAHHTVKRIIEAKTNQKVKDNYPDFNFNAFAHVIDAALDDIIQDSGVKAPESKPPVKPEEPKKTPEPPKEKPVEKPSEKKKAPKGQAGEKGSHKAKKEEPESAERPAGMEDSEWLVLSTIRTHGGDKGIQQETLQNALTALGYGMLNLTSILDKLKGGGWVLEVKAGCYKAV